MRKSLAGITWSLLGLAMILLTATSASAHHSAVGYDLQKTQMAEATLKEILWTAPHSALVFEVKGPDGKPQELLLGSASPATFTKRGFKRSDFKVGDKMVVAWHPSRNGNPGGLLSTITMKDGRVFKDALSEGLDALNSRHFDDDKK